MSDAEHPESEFYYPDELQFQKNNKLTVLYYDRVRAGQDNRNSLTVFNKPS